jgi:hypothetical protein
MKIGCQVVGDQEEGFAKGTQRLYRMLYKTLSLQGLEGLIPAVTQALTPR